MQFLQGSENPRLIDYSELKVGVVQAAEMALVLNLEIHYINPPKGTSEFAELNVLFITWKSTK